MEDGSKKLAKQKFAIIQVLEKQQYLIGVLIINLKKIIMLQ